MDNPLRVLNAGVSMPAGQLYAEAFKSLIACTQEQS